MQVLPVLTKQLWCIKAWTPQDLWMCAVVSGTKTLAEDTSDMSWKIKSGASLDFLVQHMPKILNCIEIWIWRPRQLLELLLCSSNHGRFFQCGGCIILWKRSLIRKHHEGAYVACNDLRVGGTNQSNTHVNARTQGFPANIAQTSHCLRQPAFFS